MSEQKKILIAGDESTDSRHLASMLETIGFQIAGIASTGIQAIQMAGEMEPDVLLIDIEIPGDMDGIETAVCIRDRYSIPVIFLAADCDDAVINSAQKSEPCGYIIKPVNAAILHTAIKTALKQHELENIIRIKDNQYLDTLNALSANICVLDETGTIILVNNQWNRFASDNSAISGRCGTGINYLKLCEDTKGEDRKTAIEFASGIREVMRGIRGQFSLEYKCHSSQEERWFNGTVTPLPDVSKGTNRVVISHENITGPMKSELLLHKSEESLREAAENELILHRNHLEELVKLRTIELSESERRYREIIDSITDYVYQVKIDKNKNTTTVYTENCFNVTGYHSYEFMEDHFLWLNTVIKEDRAKVKDFIISIYSGQELQERKIEHRIVHKDGSIRWIKNNIVIHKNSNGELTGYDGVISDITVRKKHEEEIVNLNLHIIKLQEEERQRVAQDLHDSVGQSLIAAKMSIDTYKQEPEYFKDQLNIGLSFLVKASQELREIYTDLYPTVLNDLGFEMAVRWLLDTTLVRFNIEVKLNLNITNGIPHDIEVGLYRIIQEIISNILKHASASIVSLSLISNEDSLELIITDNGVGFDQEIKKTGINRYGLANIKSRVTGFNGKFSIGKNDPNGIIISITIDLSDKVQCE